jgi:gas vesicle protein
VFSYRVGAIALSHKRPLEAVMDHREKDRPVVVVERDNGLGSFLIGAALGAGLALLFAPRSGEETRLELKNRGRRLRATAAEKAEELQDLLAGGYEETKAKVEDGIASARRVLDDKRVDAKDALDAGRKAVGSARDELKRQLADARAARRDEDPEEFEDDEAEVEEELTEAQ